MAEGCSHLERPLVFDSFLNDIRAFRNRRSLARNRFDLCKLQQQFLNLALHNWSQSLSANARTAKRSTGIYSQIAPPLERQNTLFHRSIKQSDNGNRNQEVRPPLEGTPEKMGGFADVQHLELADPSKPSL